MSGRVTALCVVGEVGVVIVMDEYLVVFVVVIEDTEEEINIGFVFGNPADVIAGLVGVTV